MIKLKLNKFIESNEYKKRLVWITALLLVLCVLFFSNPEKIYLTKCLFHKTTGYSCPSCGLSRSLYAASHFDFLQSFQFHLMGPIIYFSILIFLTKFSFEIIVRKAIQIEIKTIIVKIIVASFIGLWGAFSLVRVITELNKY